MFPGGTPAGWFPDPSGSGGQRYWDGQQWTSHSQPSNPYPGGTAAGQPPAPSRQRNLTLWGGVVAVIATVLVIVAFGIFGNSSVDKDGLSYRLGREYGNDTAGAALRRGGPLAPVAGDFKSGCEIQSETVASTGIHGGDIEMAANDVDADDYNAGCMDAVRDGIERVSHP
jgi:hypothetical protein